MLVTSIFSFSHNVFYPSKTKIKIFHLLLFLSSANALNLDQSKMLSFDQEWKIEHVNGPFYMYIMIQSVGWQNDFTDI